jgi:hypothetical protein
VALDYPQDWVVTENGAGVSFTPPQGSPIVLEGAQSSPAGQDCPTVINAYGQAGTVCLDAATSRYTAEFKLPPGAPTAWVILTVISQEKPAVFLQMFNTLRPLP